MILHFSLYSSIRCCSSNLLNKFERYAIRMLSKMIVTMMVPNTMAMDDKLLDSKSLGEMPPKSTQIYNLKKYLSGERDRSS